MQVTIPKLPGYEALMAEFQERLKRLSQTEVASNRELALCAFTESSTCP